MIIVCFLCCTSHAASAVGGHMIILVTVVGASFPKLLLELCQSLTNFYPNLTTISFPKTPNFLSLKAKVIKTKKSAPGQKSAPGSKKALPGAERSVFLGGKTLIATPNGEVRK